MFHRRAICCRCQSITHSLGYWLASGKTTRGSQRLREGTTSPLTKTGRLAVIPNEARIPLQATSQERETSLTSFREGVAAGTAASYRKPDQSSATRMESLGFEGSYFTLACCPATSRSNRTWLSRPVTS